MIKPHSPDTTRCPVTKLNSVEKDISHKFIAPCYNDLRSPCPALNTLANHSYLPHDGGKISITKLYNALKDGFGISSVLAFVLTLGCFFLLRQWGDITLADLGRYDLIDHDDLLMVRYQSMRKYQHCAPHEMLHCIIADLCDSIVASHKFQRPSVISEEPISPLLTAKGVGYLRHVRERSFPPPDPVRAEIAQGEMAILLGAFAARPRSPVTFQAMMMMFLGWTLPLLGLSTFFGRLETGANHYAPLKDDNQVKEVNMNGIPVDYSRIFLLRETFPDGWRPTRTTGLIETAYYLSMIRVEYKKLSAIIPLAGMDKFDMANHQNDPLDREEDVDMVSIDMTRSRGGSSRIEEVPELNKVDSEPHSSGEVLVLPIRQWDVWDPVESESVRARLYSFLNLTDDSDEDIIYPRHVAGSIASDGHKDDRTSTCSNDLALYDVVKTMH